MSSKSNHELLTLGWREWVSLPDLGIPRIKAKVDTGARTSSLHAFEVSLFTENGQRRVEFKLHPRQRNDQLITICSADVVDERTVTDSGGHKENRCIILTPVTIGANSWPVEISLTSRDDMRFRMLLGRTAINGRAMVDPSKSYLVGKKKRSRPEEGI